MLLKRGAEAEIHLTTWLNKKAIAKWRVPKLYRNKKIDDKLRKSRTKSESRLISEVKKYGVCTPIIYEIDSDECLIIMEYLQGERVKDILENIDDKKREFICSKIGEAVAKLHSNGIIHGDLTTSNMILFNKKIFFIDFGLGEKSKELEAQGVDLKVLLEAFKSAHSEVEHSFKWVLEAYKKNYKHAELVIKKMHEIAARGRYT
ncbi:MAG: KEOPS complex kinase/ATPase Bud32 [Candidatus Thermoplasmatota archaeon]|nr:KEOPS complex kinase/ATPase Bud32 [Candidatus Thermoplasmatota archaeon]